MPLSWAEAANRQEATYLQNISKAGDQKPTNTPTRSLFGNNNLFTSNKVASSSGSSKLDSFSFKMPLNEEFDTASVSVSSNTINSENANTPVSFINQDRGDNLFSSNLPSLNIDHFSVDSVQKTNENVFSSNLDNSLNNNQNNVGNIFSSNLFSTASDNSLKLDCKDSNNPFASNLFSPNTDQSQAPINAPKFDLIFGNKTQTNRSISTSATPAPHSDTNQLTSGSWQEADSSFTAVADTPSCSEASILEKIVRNGLVNNRNAIEVQRHDKSSPLNSAKSFEELRLSKALLTRLSEIRYDKPSKVQEIALPFLLENPPTNLIAQSQSGTGKTAAFVLALLSRIDVSVREPQALCLLPTYELALQTRDAILNLATHMPEVGIRMAVKGEMVSRGQQFTEQIVIGTPGKCLDVIKFKAMDMGRIRFFVLDEADVMISVQGHQEQSIKIHRQLSPSCQMVLFSATYSQEVMKFAEAIIHRPIIMRLRREQESISNIRQFYVNCRDADDKYRFITNMYGAITIGQTIIFCHSRVAASTLKCQLERDGHAVCLLSGELGIEQRSHVLEQFRAGTHKVLIATNVLSRGIDIQQVTMVFNYDLPVTVERRADCDTYLHRIGRSGRFGAHGIAINFVVSDQDRAVLAEIERHFNRKIEQLNAVDIDVIEEATKQTFV